VIRLLLLYIINEFTIALRRRSARASSGEGRALSPAGAVVDISQSTPPTPFKRIRCETCWFATDTGHHRRIPAATKLERFLQLHEWRLSSFDHSMMHVAERYGLESLRGNSLLQIRKGERAATPEQQQLLALTVSNLLGELVPPAALFDDDAALQPNIAAADAAAASASPAVREVRDLLSIIEGRSHHDQRSALGAFATGVSAAARGRA
jgi:hypothetical protein